MAGFRWVKGQDFCLRLGLLKALVAVLPTQRQPVPRENVLRKLRRLLPARAATDPDAERFLRSSTARSWGQPIHAETVAKVLEWGQGVGLVTSGNRITERGLLLRSLMDAGAVGRFAAGDLEVWNPFSMTPWEQVFFLYHLGEVDELLWQLAVEVGRVGAGRTLVAGDAHRLTAAGLRKVLTRAEPIVALQDRAAFATVRELAAIIDWEISQDPLKPRPRSRHEKIVHPRSVVRTGRGDAKKGRITTKNTDHQAIPRFEQLVDLGFLTKPPVAPGSPDEAKVMKGWTFVVTDVAQRFASAFGGDERFDNPNWHWFGFAACVAKSGLVGDPFRAGTRDEALEAFLRGYKALRRPFGNTPFESAAIFGVIDALRAGLVLEVAELHRVLLEIKEAGREAEGIFFAAGNSIDRMFVMVKNRPTRENRL